MRARYYVEQRPSRGNMTSFLCTQWLAGVSTYLVAVG